VWGTFHHLTSKTHRNDHLEMCLHHFITLSLYAGGHMMGDIYSGLFVVFIMDFSDIWSHLAKATCDTQWKRTCGFFGFNLWFWWAYTRLYCLPYCIYWMLFIYPYDIPNMSGSYEGNLYFFKGMMLSLLTVMSIWWWYLICKVIYKVIFKGV